MVVRGTSGVLMKLVGHMGLLFGNSLGGLRRNFRGFSRFEVDNGSKVRF